MIANYLVVGAVLFSLGTVGFLARRNMIVMFLSAEMMLQGVSLSLVAFGRAWSEWPNPPNWNGQAFTLFVLTVAAAEAAIALALVLSLYRRKRSLDVSLWQDLREPDQPPIRDEPEEFVVPPESPQLWPRLPPTGVEPPHTQDELEEEVMDV